MEKTSLHGNFVAADRCLVAELSLMGKIYRIPEYLFDRRAHPGNVGLGDDGFKSYRPGVGEYLIFPEWSVLGKHLKAVDRFRGSIATKFRLYGAVFGWFFSRIKIFRIELTGNLRKVLTKLTNKGQGRQG